jgi:glycosyltransferase involved in cell wall biosynthesis
MRAMLGHVDAFMSPSRHLRDRLVAHFALDPARVVVAPFGLVPFARAPLTARDPGARLRIGFVGSVNFHKGVHVLLDAFAGGLDADLVVVGPVSTGFAAARGADLRARASVRGPVGAGERHAIYEDIDVLVLPSVCHENFPLVIQEAFMAGLPVVASDLAGMAENVRHEVDGLLVPPGDAPALRRALQRLIDDPSLVDRLRKGVPPVKSMEAHAREVAEVFARACARARA